MAETHGFYRLPPDGSGKRVPATLLLEFDYNTKTGPIALLPLTQGHVLLPP